MLTFAIHNTITKVAGPDKSLALVWHLLSYQDNSQAFARRFKGRKPAPTTKSFLDRRNYTFLTGLLPRVLPTLDAHGVPYTLLDQRPRVDIDPARMDFGLHGIELRPYQEKAIQDFLAPRTLGSQVLPWQGRGVAHLATGAGKTEIAIAITKGLARPTLFLTHRTNLLTQTARRFMDRLPHLKNRIGVLGGGMFEPKLVTVATVQTLWSHIKRHPQNAREFLSQFQVLIVDEAHRSGAKQFYAPATLCTGAPFRLALTATPFMKGNAADDMFLMGTTGPVVARVTNGELIRDGVLARPFFKFLPVTAPDLRHLSNWRDVYEHGIIYNRLRNELVARQALSLTNMGKKTLVVVHEVAHGQLLEELIRDAGVRVRFVAGKDTHEEREQALSQVRRGKVDVLVATNIFDEGIDVKDIAAVILAAGNKSAPALFQRTGRAIRAKEGDENYAIIIDFLDQTHPILERHARTRYELVRAEDGFEIL